MTVAPSSWTGAREAQGTPMGQVAVSTDMENAKELAKELMKAFIEAFNMLIVPSQSEFRLEWIQTFSFSG